MILNWNARGIGSSRTFRTSRTLYRQFNPDIILISKTKTSSSKVDHIHRRLSYKHGASIPASGLSDGLALFWIEELSIQGRDCVMMDLNEMTGTGSTSSRSYGDDMRGNSGQETASEELLFDSSVGDEEAEEGLTAHFSNPGGYVAEESNENYPFALALPLHWQHVEQPMNNEMGFPSSSSTRIHACPTKDLPQGVPLPLCSILPANVSEFPGEMSSNKSGMESQSAATVSAQYMGAVKVMPSTYVVNNNNVKTLTNPCGALVPYQQHMLEGETCDVHMNRALAAPESTEMGSNSYQSPTVTIAFPGLPSRHRSATPRAIADRVRRAAISDRLKALRELLRHSDMGKRDAVLDDTIDYVKYLQLQIKVLSQSRLGGEAVTHPISYVEGFGHYLHRDHKDAEPLEEMIGKLMETNMLAATQLLESKGLFLRSTSLAEQIP